MTEPKFSVLVVEDDGPTRRGLRALLTAAGYDVTAANGYREGRRALLARRPDLLLADLRLGEFNGLQLLLVYPHSLPAIMVTGFADPVLAQQAVRLGATFVVKPIAPEALLELVAHTLAKQTDAAR